MANNFHYIFYKAFIRINSESLFSFLGPDRVPQAKDSKGVFQYKIVTLPLFFLFFFSALADMLALKAAGFSDSITLLPPHTHHEGSCQPFPSLPTSLSLVFGRQAHTLPVSPGSCPSSWPS